MPHIIIRLENLAIALLVLFVYSYLGLSWKMFAILIITPDLSMLGYLVNSRVGAITYNIVHNYALVTVLYLASNFLPPNFDHHEYLATYALNLAIHIGFDRALGLGLKYPDKFKHTHLQEI